MIKKLQQQIRDQQDKDRLKAKEIKKKKQEEGNKSDRVE